MATFDNLPRSIQEQIYRLHLVQEAPITVAEHEKIIGYSSDVRHGRSMPPLLTLSRKTERIAAPIYYGANHFVFDRVAEVELMRANTWPRHMRFVRKITCTWGVNYTSSGMSYLASLKGLQELDIRVNEVEMVAAMLYRHKSYRRKWQFDPTPQQQLEIMHHPGMIGLLKLSSVPHVRFTKRVNREGEEVGGPRPGGMLEALLASKFQMPTNMRRSHRHDEAGFPFLSLPSELRNRIYDLILRISGPVSPSTRPPTSATKRLALHDPKSIPHSALSLLAVNRQIHDEAVGIFYSCNSFIFDFSIHLHGFLQSLGPQRSNFIRDITVQYVNVKSGGMSMIELTFALLVRLTGLKKLEVIMKGDLYDRVVKRDGLRPALMERANPNAIPGLKILFRLRGVEEIKVRDLSLERSVKAMETQKEYPNFPAGSTRGCKLELARALAHFNAALTEAQEGIINTRVLEDERWHLEVEFPALMGGDKGRSTRA